MTLKERLDRLKKKIAFWLAEREFKKQAVRFLERTLGRPLTRKEKSVMTNWKTTLLGIVAGLVGVSASTFMAPDGKINVWGVVQGIVLALIGYFAKDRDVTGGTIQQ